MRESRITPIDDFDDIDIVEVINYEGDYWLDVTFQQIMLKISRGDLIRKHLDYEDVDVRFWLPEMNSVNVTMFCDRMLEKCNAFDGFICLVTGKNDIDCLSVLTIEDQSSGFEIYKQETVENKSMLIMRANPSKIKNELNIPDNPWRGFRWDNKHPDQPIPSHQVPTAQYNSKYILNFSVSGEFDLEVYYLPYDGEYAILLWEKYFCCK